MSFGTTAVTLPFPSAILRDLRDLCDLCASAVRSPAFLKRTPTFLPHSDSTRDAELGAVEYQFYREMIRMN